MVFDFVLVEHEVELTKQSETGAASPLQLTRVKLDDATKQLGLIFLSPKKIFLLHLLQ